MSHVNLPGPQNFFSNMPYVSKITPKAINSRFTIQVIPSTWQINFFDIIVNNQTVYSGFIENELAEWHGTYYFHDGLVFVGAFVKGFMQGKGILSFPNEGSYYIGEFMRGQAAGKGKLCYANGTIYEGEFDHNVQSRLSIPQGYGILLYEGGETYEGNFQDGVPVGRGKHTDKDGSCMGEFTYRLQKDHEPCRPDVHMAKIVEVWRKGSVYLGGFNC